jgi:hypothetical protein
MKFNAEYNIFTPCLDAAPSQGLKKYITNTQKNAKYAEYQLLLERYVLVTLH